MIATAKNITVKEAERVIIDIIKGHQQNLKKDDKAIKNIDEFLNVIGWGASWTDGRVVLFCA